MLVCFIVSYKTLNTVFANNGNQHLPLPLGLIKFLKMLYFSYLFSHFCQRSVWSANFMSSQFYSELASAFLGTCAVNFYFPYILGYLSHNDHTECKGFHYNIPYVHKCTLDHIYLFHLFLLTLLITAVSFI